MLSASEAVKDSSPSWAGRTAGALVVLAFYGTVFLFTFHEADEDVWGRMASGRLAASLGHVPLQDVFAFVPTKPLWVDHEWLSGRIFYELERRWGPTTLILLRALCGLLAVGLAYRIACTGGASPWSAAAMALAVWILLAIGYNSVVRAQAFSFPLFALFLMALESKWYERRVVFALLVALTAVWANLHGGFVVGVLLIAAYAAARLLAADWRGFAQLTGLALAAFGTSILNPFGLDYWRYLATALAMPRPEIVEWRAVVPSLDFQVLLAIGLVLLLLVFGGKLKLERFAVLAAVALASVAHVRFAPFLGLCMLAFLPGSFETVLERAGAAFPRRWLPSVVPLVAMLLLQALAVVGLLTAWTHRDASLTMRVPEDRYPVAAVKRLQSEPRGARLAIYFDWGEYALYHLYPEHRVSIDGRYETVYDDEVVKANWDFTAAAAGSELFLSRYGATHALYPVTSGAAGWLERAPDWRRVSSDELFVLYESTGPGSRR